MAAREQIRARSGHVFVESDGRSVAEVSLHPGPGPDRGDGPLAADLRRYLAGEAVDFSKYTVDLATYTPFERAVLRAARAIPYGETRTYGDIAKAIGRPDAARAVGQALGKNRTCIVIPCHRVVAANGLGGFTGGLRWKKELLALEHILPVSEP